MNAGSTAFHRLRAPRTWALRPADLAALLVGNGLLIGAMWVRHGQLAELGSWPGMLMAAGQLSALYGTYLVLLQLILMSRSPWLDQVLGPDRVLDLHRWVGFSAILLLVAHGVLTTAGYALATGSTFTGEAIRLLTTYPYVLMATVGIRLFVAVGISSVRLARRRLSYETWYGIHLYAYLAIALTFLHQLAVGTDFVGDPVARLYWIALYLLAAALLVAFRIGQPLRLSLRHRLRVANVVQEAPGVVSIYVTGRDLDRLAVSAGQWFRWRFLTTRDWWRSHPFSLSAAPSGRFLRLTVKDLGDQTRALQSLRVGTPVFIEGPYGRLTGAQRTRPGVLLVAGGIGVTPLRALLEELPAAPGELVLLYRAGRAEDVVFGRELEELAELRGATIHYLVGRRGTPALPTDPLEPASLRRLVPDVRQRDVYVCGPLPMMQAVRRSLRALRVPDSQIHQERFAF
ncbi:MAG: ferredoxin reductase family protein [Candidatus Limnocylindrales bacterium]